MFADKISRYKGQKKEVECVGFAGHFRMSLSRVAIMISFYGKRCFPIVFLFSSTNLTQLRESTAIKKMLFEEELYFSFEAVQP
jgi:hypothetical protein